MNEMISKAQMLLEKCSELSLASINENGYPRVCIISKGKTEGVKTIFMSTGTNSKKTGHFKNNPKASICYCQDKDSVTLLGNITIVEDMEIKKENWVDWFIEMFPGGVEDPNFCVLRFDTSEATMWIDGIFETHSI